MSRDKSYVRNLSDIVLVIIAAIACIVSVFGSASALVSSINLTSPPPNTYINNATPTFTFSVLGNSSNYTCMLFANATSIGLNATTLNNTLTTIVSNTTLPEGNYGWALNCSDPDGSNMTSPRPLVIDITPPSILFVNGTNMSGTYTQNVINFNVSVTDVNFANMTVYLYNATGGIVTSLFANYSQFSNAFTNLSNGAYYINATAFDLAGNSNTTQTLSYNISFGGGGSGPSSGSGLSQFSSSLSQGYIFWNTTQNITFQLVRQTSSSDCLANLTIILPANYSYAGYNSTIATNYSFSASGNTLFWNSTASGLFFCGNDSGFQSQNNFTVSITSTDSLQAATFQVLGYKEVNGTLESINMTIYTAIPMSYTGHIVDLNGNNLTNATGSVIVISMGMNGQAQLGVFSNLTDSNGVYNISGIPSLNSTGGGFSGSGAGGLFYKLDANLYNDSTDTYALAIGPSLPNLPEFMFKQMLGNITVHLSPAVTFHVRVTGDDYMHPNMNGTFNQTNVSFGYNLKDKRLDYDVASSFTQDSNNRLFSASLARNYTLQLYPQASFPLAVPLDNIASQCNSTGYNISATGVDATCTIINTTAGNIYIVDAVISSQMNITPLTGNIMLADNTSNFTNVRIIPYLLGSDGTFATFNELPFNLGQMQRYPRNDTNFDDYYNATTGAYKIFLPATMTNSSMLLIAYAVKNGIYYEAMVQVNGVGDVLTPSAYNFTLSSLGSGALVTVSSNNVDANWNVTPLINTTAIVFNMVNSSGSLLSTESPFVKLQYTYNGASYTEMINAVSGQFNATIPNGTSISKLTIYSQNYAPISMPVASSLFASGVYNITLSQMDPRDPTTNTSFSNLRMILLRSNSTCDVPYPNMTQCSVFDGNMSSFSPFQAILSGDISFRMSLGNITVHYVKTDLLASGPPDALFTQNATTGSGFAAAWKFGSTGPEIYDSVILGMPYDPSLNTSNLSVSIPILYDQNFNVVWNASQNNTSQLSSDYSNYLNTSYEAYLNGTNVSCSTTDPTLQSDLCYNDVNNSMIWMKIPHFSGVGPTIIATNATSMSNLSNNSSSSSSSSSSGGGGGGGGGGTYTNGSSEDVLSHATQSFEDLPEGETFMNFSSDDMSFETIGLVITSNVSNAAITLSSVSNPSETFSGIVYGYMQIDHPAVNDSIIGGATINFKVSDSWILSNNLSRSNIVLERYDGTSWAELGATVTSDDGTYTHFVAHSPGLSLYAISTRQQATTAPLQNSTQGNVTSNSTSSMTSNTSATATNNTQKNVTTTAQPQASGSSNALGIIIALVVIAIVAVFMIVQRRKNKGEDSA